MGIQVKNISKNFGDFNALKNVSLEIKSGELVALLGPSGSGKTTLLRIIAGLDFADFGQLQIDGEESSNKHVQQRNVGFMFQHYALFKHMTVFENVAFGLRVQNKKTRPSKAAIQERVLELLKLVHLEGLHQRYPSQLSGGQRQRVALARALAVQPKVLLLDEPFGALDAKVRKELRRFMRRLHEEINVTTIFVTHDQEEAMEVADKVVVMSNGKIEQAGTPDEVWNKPANGFVYDFLGNFNEFAGWKDKDGNVHLTEYDVVSSKKPNAIVEEKRSLAGRLLHKLLPESLDEFSANFNEQKPNVKSNTPSGGKTVRLFARPHEMFVAKEIDEHEYITAKITHINPAGSLVKLELERVDGSALQAEIPADVVNSLGLKKNDNVFLRPRKTKVFE